MAIRKKTVNRPDPERMRGRAKPLKGAKSKAGRREAQGLSAAEKMKSTKRYQRIGMSLEQAQAKTARRNASAIKRQRAAGLA